MRELRIVDKNGKRITGFGTNVFRELTGGRYVTLARRDTSRLLFEKVKGTTEVIFDNEIVGLQQSIAEDRRRDPQAAEPPPVPQAVPMADFSKFAEDVIKLNAKNGRGKLSPRSTPLNPAAGP